MFPRWHAKSPHAARVAIVDYDADSLVKAVAGILLNPAVHSSMREKALALAAEYDWDAIWVRTLREMENLQKTKT